MIKKTKKDRLEKKMKYIKINRKDYYMLIKKVKFLTTTNNVLTEQNENYRKEIMDLKYDINNNKNTVKNNDSKEYDQLNNNYDKNYEENMPMHEDENIESDLEDMEDELYEENSSVDSNNDIECDDTSSIDSNTSNYSTTKNVDNDRKRRKDYIKINNNDENLKVLNRLKKNNLNLQKCKNNVVLNDVIINNRNTLKLFSDLHTKIENSEINCDDIYEIYDKNKSRFIKNLQLSFKMFNNEKIRNSNFVFPLYTFNSIKKNSIDDFIKLILEIV